MKRNKNNGWKRFVMCSVVFSLLCTGGGCGGPLREEAGEYARTEAVMGTFLQIKISDPELSPQRAYDVLERSVQRAKDLEKIFSIYYSDSEVNELNRKKSITRSPELYSLIEYAKKVSRLTGGAFDITVAPFMKKKGFYENLPEDILADIPSDESAVGWRNVILRAESDSIILKRGAWIDLSGIAKGYIVDRVYDFIASEGVAGVMVNAGGDIFCGAKPDGSPWRIGIRDPGTKKVAMVLEVKGKAVATSGDYENVVITDGDSKPLTHIVDPNRAVSLEMKPCSVTVIAPTCTQADALATGFMVMGPEKAYRLVDLIPDVEAVFIDNSSGQMAVTYSAQAHGYVREGDRR